MPAFQFELTKVPTRTSPSGAEQAEFTYKVRLKVSDLLLNCTTETLNKLGVTAETERMFGANGGWMVAVAVEREIPALQS